MRSIDRSGLRQLIDEGRAQVIDVLPEPEYLRSHIPGAVNLPLPRLDSEAVAHLDRSQPVVVYCHDGL